MEKEGDEGRWLIAALDTVPSCPFLLSTPFSLLNSVPSMVRNVHKSLGNPLQVYLCVRQLLCQCMQAIDSVE